MTADKMFSAAQQSVEIKKEILQQKNWMWRGVQSVL